MLEKRNFILAAALTSFSSALLADQFHYSNFLIGDRAIGLGGAYGGVSDDASGVYYNPAGLAFALSNDVSGSANAFYTKKVVYKSAVGDHDFTEHSGGSVPSFFGGLQKLDHVMKGLVFAFGVYSNDSELKDQNDTIKNVTLVEKPTGCNELGDDNQPTGVVNPRDPVVLDRFHRTVNQRGSSVYFGGGLGYRLAGKVAIGAALNLVTIDELIQEYQDVRTRLSLCTQKGAAQKQVKQQMQNIRQHLTATGVQPVLGIQTAVLGRLSLGLTLKMGSFFNQDFVQSVEMRSMSLGNEDYDALNNAAGKPIVSQSGILVSSSEAANGEDGSNKGKPLGKMPLDIRFGSALFYSTRLLFTGDINYVGGTKDAGLLGGADAPYAKNSVVNYALGMEYYLTPALPLRLGYFRNNDARPVVDEKKSGQRDHVDYNGFTAFLAWVQPNSQIGIGGIAQLGSGVAQKIAGSVETQKVDAESYTFAFSATHSF